MKQHLAYFEESYDDDLQLCSIPWPPKQWRNAQQFNVYRWPSLNTWMKRIIGNDYEQCIELFSSVRLYER